MPRCMQTRGAHRRRSGRDLATVTRLLLSSRGAAYKHVDDLLKAHRIPGPNVCAQLSKMLGLVPDRCVGRFFDLACSLIKAGCEDDLTEAPQRLVDRAREIGAGKKRVEKIVELLP